MAVASRRTGASRRVLILTAGFGEGHNAAARNVRAALLERGMPEEHAVVRDVFSEAYGAVNTLAERAYLYAISQHPKLWMRFFKLMHETKLVDKHIGIFSLSVRRLRHVINDFLPDVILSTYPAYAHLLATACGNNATYRLVTCITDSVSINSVWHRTPSHAYIAANEATARTLHEQGVAREKIEVLGFPVPLVFAHLNEKVEPPPNGDPWRVLLMVNATERLAPAIAEALLPETNLHLTVTCGRNDQLERRIRSIAFRAGRPVDTYGWTNLMPRLIARSHVIITKAGGATVQECLAAGTPLVICRVVPGQEQGNADLVAFEEAGLIAVTPAEIQAALRRIFDVDGARWAHMHQNALRIGTPDGAYRIADYLMSF